MMLPSRLVSPRWFRLAINLWPPLLGTGIHVTHIAPDWRETRVTMPLRFYNRNIMGSHFGGSLYAMTDPFYMMMLMGIFGDGYHVWDAAAEIQFVKPGRKRVNADFVVTAADIAAIDAATAGGEKYFHTFETELRDTDGVTVARVRKVVYIRRKKEQRPPEAA